VIEGFGTDIPRSDSHPDPNGSDASRVEPVDAQRAADEVDEVREYIDCRYLSSHEALYGVRFNLIYTIGHQRWKG
jgi:hypothetical protein